VYRIKTIGMKYEEWVVLEIRFYLYDLVLLNITKEKIVATLMKKLGDLYQDKPLVNKWVSAS
jgi:hypothetical protein